MTQIRRRGEENAAFPVIPGRRQEVATRDKDWHVDHTRQFGERWLGMCQHVLDQMFRCPVGHPIALRDLLPVRRAIQFVAKSRPR